MDLHLRVRYILWKGFVNARADTSDTTGRYMPSVHNIFVIAWS